MALPPYNKFSNISDDIKNEINFKLYKSWTLKNILHTDYQNFVVQLLELDLCKIIDENVEKNHKELVKFMRDDGFPPIESKGLNPEVNNNEIFEFCLRYYFNVILRVSRKQEKSSPQRCSYGTTAYRVQTHRP